VSPVDSPTFDNTTGVFSVASISSPFQAANTTVAEVVPLLTGNCYTSVNVTITFSSIRSVDQPASNVPEERSNSIVLLRGDTDGNGQVDIGDASWIAQKVVGMRDAYFE